ncbi:uncharacterized protein TRUGW13939_09694 [Talaromyces rugulosus]|uniref:Protein kinase domain-containing protein n=1 Tax=Talaromyces rugulosus TaxID=121627 RepID=A0A7H8RDA4_TALRU|nr:uncharacterized protein TRUGW13939_09694 [Talaromyces rugulosus]QKX62533.1 hypothetical protein TRUGW13939_09694 [Talaromyces rugulosus]
MTATRRVSQFPHTLLSQEPKPALKSSIGDTAPKSKKTVSFDTGGSLNPSRRPSRVTKSKGPRLTKDVKRRDENPWEVYVFVDEIIKKHETVTKVRKMASGQMFCFRTFPVDKNFEVIEQQFKLLDHHNVLPAQEFFRQGDRGLIRSPVTDVSFERIVVCRQYPSSRALASMMGQVMDGLVYLVSNGIICNSLSLAFADAEIQKDIRASTTILIRQLALIMVLLMQKYENGPGETSIQDSARWPPQDEACKFLQDLQNNKDFHQMHYHSFIDPKKRDGNGFKDLIEKTSDTTLESHVRLTEEETFHSV